jgi:calcineurin-like phosphoesterase family protein
MSILFTADTHFGHANIIKWSTARQAFPTVEAMDEELITRWNQTVRPEDTVWHLGDFSWGKVSVANYLRRLNGTIHVIFGNHDKPARQAAQLFASAADYREIKVEGQLITLCHYAMLTFNKAHYGAWQLHGHSHGSLPDDPKVCRLDVGVDCWDLRPVSFARLRSRMSLKTFAPVDHHVRK